VLSSPRIMWVLGVFPIQQFCCSSCFSAPQIWLQNCHDNESSSLTAAFKWEPAHWDNTTPQYAWLQNQREDCYQLWNISLDWKECTKTDLAFLGQTIEQIGKCLRTTGVWNYIKADITHLTINTYGCSNWSLRGSWRPCPKLGGFHYLFQRL
jgi:hypothetical protein